MSSRICRLTNSPSPVPWALVVKKGWKSRQRSAIEMPRPSSSTVRTSQPSSTAGREMNPSLVVGRVDRVQDEVQDDLGQVVAHADDRRQLGRDVGRDRSLLGALVVLGDSERFVDDLADPHPAHRLGRRPRKVDQLADRPLDPLQLPRGQVELFGGVGVRARAAGGSAPASSGRPADCRPRERSRRRAVRTPPSSPAGSPAPARRAGPRSAPRPAAPGWHGPSPARRSSARALRRPRAASRPATSWPTSPRP